jgi:hypothetical protein
MVVAFVLCLHVVPRVIADWKWRVYSAALGNAGNEWLCGIAGMGMISLCQWFWGIGDVFDFCLVFTEYGEWLHLYVCELYREGRNYYTAVSSLETPLCTAIMCSALMRSKRAHRMQSSEYFCQFEWAWGTQVDFEASRISLTC